MGRAKEVNAFVKHGTQEGYIELELWGSEEEGRTTTLIRREISKNEKSSVWRVNGEGEVEEEA